MKRLRFCSVLLLVAMAGCASLSERPSSVVLGELAPMGKLRVGVVVAPAASGFFVTRDAKGQPRGVAVDLGTALAHNLGVPVEFVMVPNSGEVTEALATGAIDVTFMPLDDERKKLVDFGPAYMIGENTYLVTARSGIKTLADVDRPNIRVVGVTNSTTIRAAGGLLKNTKIMAVNSVDEAVDLLRADKADAFPMSSVALRPLVAQVPGARILDGAFQRIITAVAVARNRPAALAYATTFMEQAKASGLVRRAFDEAGLKDIEVAPPSPRT